MNIAIVGSNSFLAQYIIRELQNSGTNLNLFGIMPSKEFPSLKFTSFVLPDSPLDYKILLNFDTIIYTAGAGIQANLKEPSSLIYELNTFIPINLINELCEHNYAGKFISFGSYFEIGNEKNKKLYSEHELLISTNEVPNEYCISKRLLAKYISLKLSSINIFHLVLPNIYGKGENPNRLIPYTVESILNNTDLNLTSGSQVRQFIHVSDVAKTVVDIHNNQYSSGIYNLTQGTAHTVKDVVKNIFKVGKQEKNFEKVVFGTNSRKDVFMPYLLLDNKKSSQTFSFQPQISLEEGIKSYYE